MKSSNIEYKKLKRQQGKKIKTFLLFSLICLTCGLVYGLLKSKEVLKLDKVEVQGAKTYVNGNDVKTMVIAQTADKNVLTLNTDFLEKTLKANFLGAEGIKVKKNVNGTVSVEINERKPIALITQKEATYIVDVEGYVLGNMDPTTTNLPKIEYMGKIKIGQFIDGSLVPIYKDIIMQLDSEKIKVSSISVSDYDVKMYVDDGVEVILSKKNYSSDFSPKLKEALAYVKKAGKSARRIDLRYDKVILTLN